MDQDLAVARNAAIDGMVGGCALFALGDGVEVGRSAIGGLFGRGLFATRSFKRGQWITWYDGETITMATARARAAVGADSHIKRLGLAFGLCVDGAFQPSAGRGGASFANHVAANANTEYGTPRALELFGTVCLRAKVAIVAGDEITVRYEGASAFQRRLARELPSLAHEVRLCCARTCASRLACTVSLCTCVLSRGYLSG